MSNCNRSYPDIRKILADNPLKDALTAEDMEWAKKHISPVNKPADPVVRKMFDDLMCIYEQFTNSTLGIPYKQYHKPGKKMIATIGAYELETTEFTAECIDIPTKQYHKPGGQKFTNPCGEILLPDIQTLEFPDPYSFTCEDCNKSTSTRLLCDICDKTMICRECVKASHYCSYETIICNKCSIQLNNDTCPACLHDLKLHVTWVSSPFDIFGRKVPEHRNNYTRTLIPCKHTITLFTSVEDCKCDLLLRVIEKVSLRK